MIEIKLKKDCVGCNACVQRCPKHCIHMLEDEQGFLYPKVDVDRCIECGLCESVCPVINQSSPKKPVKVYASRNPDTKILMSSSSGGVFYALAKHVIEEGGVVFGAKFNDKWMVVHDFVESLERLNAFQGSKYVQSRIDTSFKTTEKFLKEGRKVMFTGTPCQIAGLRLFLRKPYDNLYTVDVVCHGAPSPLVWSEYLKYITRPKAVAKNTDFQSTLFDKIPVITGINFRDKRLGWEKFGFSVQAVARKGDKNSDFQSTNGKPEQQELLFQPHYENLYMQIFLKDLDLRPSCYACPAKCGKSHSDITLADFWKIKEQLPEKYDYNGVSLLLVNSVKGETLLNSVSLNLDQTKYEYAIIGNRSIENSVDKPKQYDYFWRKFQQTGFDDIHKILSSMKPSIIQRIANKALKLIKRTI